MLQEHRYKATASQWCTTVYATIYCSVTHGCEQLTQPLLLNSAATGGQTHHHFSHQSNALAISGYPVDILLYNSKLIWHVLIRAD